MAETKKAKGKRPARRRSTVPATKAVSSSVQRTMTKDPATMKTYESGKGSESHLWIH